jgi:pyruvate dehydrogenase E2 component (dihydrolipoamide acetyltransferase)
VLASITQSWQAIPHIHIIGELEADGLARAKSLAPEGATVTDLLVLAVGRALRDVPDLNGTVDSKGAPRRVDQVNLALAVATPGGVVAPVLRDAGTLPLERISAERSRLVAAARGETLDKRDLGGATCTLSNLGAYPVDVFAPVISAPQISLIATGRLAEKPVAVDGMIAVRNRIWVNAAIDHRGADGEAGGRFLAALERRLADLPTSI